MATAVICDRLLPEGRCGRLATARNAISWSDGAELVAMDLCDSCAEAIAERMLLEGAPPGDVRVDYKPRRAYVAKSGRRFSAEEARAWLIEQGRASDRGRLSKAQLEEYGDAH